MNPADLPDRWFETHQIEMTDTPFGYFIYAGLPTLGLFMRDIPSVFTREKIGFPMAIGKADRIFLIAGCRTKGVFRPAVQLRLVDEDGGETGLTIPFSAAPKSFVPFIKHFLAYVQSVESTIQPAWGRDCLFVPSPSCQRVVDCAPRSRLRSAKL